MSPIIDNQNLVQYTTNQKTYVYMFKYLLTTLLTIFVNKLIEYI